MGVFVQYESDINGIDSGLVEKIGSDTLTTTSKNLSGAVNELNSSLANKATEDYVDNSIDTAITQVINNSY
jgi:hypothetical protein